LIFYFEFVNIIIAKCEFFKIKWVVDNLNRIVTTRLKIFFPKLRNYDDFVD